MWIDLFMKVFNGEAFEKVEVEGYDDIYKDEVDAKAQDFKWGFKLK